MGECFPHALLARMADWQNWIAPRSSRTRWARLPTFPRNLEKPVTLGLAF